jgi:beta-ureidopropionase / N-carbamoyl-L-amino-acid hydrolase
MIDIAAFERDMAAVSAFGATPDGGVCRLSAGKEDGRARDWFVARLKAEGFDVRVDPIGNVFGLARTAAAEAPWLLTGSHLDSQPTGGKYDGAYGVIASLHAAIAVKRIAGLTRNLAVVDWTNEEGARYQPSLMGSGVYTGALALEAALSARDGDGIPMGRALAEIGYAGTQSGPAPAEVASYLEIHIEQGPALERAGRKIGVVTGNWGTAKYVVDFRGKAAHTGPTPMAERRDALLPAAELILAVRRLSDETGGALLGSVGRLEVGPNSSNVVPETVTLFAELRDVDGARLAEACARFRATVDGLRGKGIEIALRQTVDRKVAEFDPGIRSVIAAVSRAQGHEPLELRTVAGHDAVPVSAKIPTAMIFVPSRNGISHNAAEFTAPEDLATGAQVLAGALLDLARR